jgi:hypothetical protein
MYLGKYRYIIYIVHIPTVGVFKADGLIQFFN